MHDDENTVEVKRFLVSHDFLDNEEEVEEEDLPTEGFRDMTAVLDDDVRSQEDQFYVDLFSDLPFVTPDLSPRSQSDGTTSPGNSPRRQGTEWPSFGDEAELEKVSAGEDSDSSVDPTDYRTTILTQLGQEYSHILVPDLPETYMDTRRPVWHNLAQLHASIKDGNHGFVRTLSELELDACEGLLAAIRDERDTSQKTAINLTNILLEILEERQRRIEEKRKTQ